MNSDDILTDSVLTDFYDFSTKHASANECTWSACRLALFIYSFIYLLHIIIIIIIIIQVFRKIWTLKDYGLQIKISIMEYMF